MQSIINRIRRHRSAVWLVVTALLIPLLQNLASSWLEATLGQTPSRLFQLLSGLLLAALLLGFLYFLLNKERPVEIVAEERRPPRHSGLITLVSRRNVESGRVPAHELAIRYHLDEESVGGEPLRICWLIASGGRDGTVPEARAMRERFGTRCKIVIKEIKDPFDLYETYQAVQNIYAEATQNREISLQSSQIIGDFTGGTTPMSAGVVLACHGLSSMQYIQGGIHQTVAAKIASTPVWIKFQTL